MSSMFMSWSATMRAVSYTHLLRLQGLKEDARYELKEINLVPGTQSRLACNGKTFSGEFLMNVGIPVFSSRPTNSHVIEITEVK